MHDLRGDGIEPELGPSEHPERVGGAHHTPGDVDEPLSRRAVDLRTAQIGSRPRGDELTSEFPDRRGDIGRYPSEQVLLALAALHRNVNIVMAVWEVRSWPAGAARKVESLDAKQHAHHRRAGDGAGTQRSAGSAVNTPVVGLAVRHRPEIAGEERSAVIFGQVPQGTAPIH